MIANVDRAKLDYYISDKKSFKFKVDGVGRKIQ